MKIHNWPRRILSALTVCLVLLGAGGVRVRAELDLASEAAILMDAETGQVLFAKNAGEQLYPASITKVMTAMLTLQSLEPEQLLTVSQTAVDAVPRTSSHISLLTGEQLTVEQALYAIGMESANDAANVLAEAVSGDLASFAQRMTQQAADLGAVHTQFTNANGLPDSQHYTTAYDMALITAAALKIPGLSEYFSRVDYVLPATNLSAARTFSNKNRLLPGGQYAYDGVLMAKTGWTTSAQGTFVAAVRRGDMTLIAVTLKSPLLEDKYKDTWKLMDYGFSHYTRVSVTGEELASWLTLGDYAPISGQSLCFLMTTTASRETLRYRLSSPLPEVDEDAVTVAVELEGEAVAVLPLWLRRNPPPRAVVQAVDVLLEETVQTVEKHTNWILIGAGGVLLLLGAGMLRRQHARMLRRRRLHSRIERMKRQITHARRPGD